MDYKELIKLIKTHIDYMQFITILEADKDIKESLFEAYKVLALQKLYLNGLEWDGKLTDEFLIND